MLRPSRPMMRPFSSSDFELHDRDRGLDGVAAPTRCMHGGEDAARAAVGVVAGLLLDLADQPGAVVAQLVLELAQQDLLGLPGAQARHPLELAQLLALGLLELARGLSSRLRSRSSSARSRWSSSAPCSSSELSCARRRSSRRAISSRRARELVLDVAVGARLRGRGSARRSRSARVGPPVAPATAGARPRGRSSDHRRRATAAATSGRQHDLHLAVSSSRRMRGAGLVISSGRLGAARHQTAASGRALPGARDKRQRRAGTSPDTLLCVSVRWVQS